MTTIEEAMAALDPRIRKRLTNGVDRYWFGEVSLLLNHLYAYR